MKTVAVRPSVAFFLCSWGWLLGGFWITAIITILCCRRIGTIRITTSWIYSFAIRVYVILVLVSCLEALDNCLEDEPYCDFVVAFDVLRVPVAEGVSNSCEKRLFDFLRYEPRGVCAWNERERERRKMKFMFIIIFISLLLAASAGEYKIYWLYDCVSARSLALSHSRILWDEKCYF
jgi:hypothetical protein